MVTDGLTDRPTGKLSYRDKEQEEEEEEEEEEEGGGGRRRRRVRLRLARFISFLKMVTDGLTDRPTGKLSCRDKEQEEEEEEEEREKEEAVRAKLCLARFSVCPSVHPYVPHSRPSSQA